MTEKEMENYRIWKIVETLQDKAEEIQQGLDGESLLRTYLQGKIDALVELRILMSGGTDDGERVG